MFEFLLLKFCPKEFIYAAWIVPGKIKKAVAYATAFFIKSAS